MRKLLAIILVAIALGASAADREWTRDIDFVQKQIEMKHPMPFRRVDRAQWLSGLNRLKSDLPKLTDDEAAVRLMAMVAMLRDAHTTLFPTFDTWFPVRFYQFSDGVFITAIDKRFEHLAGARVERIGTCTIADAVDRVERVFSSDNEFGALEATVLLSSPRILRALKITPEADVLPLELRLRDGSTTIVEIQSVKSRAGFAWRMWGEMFGPPGAELVTAFSGKTDFTDPDANADLPLHLRGRRAYWSTWLPSTQTLYAQINAMADRSAHTRETFREFLDRVFEFADVHPVDRFVLDVRYNGGGNGRLVNAIVHELVKRDRTINRRGHFFVITGRKTLSAGVGLVVALREHTHAIFVGEPVGAALNSAGDADTTTLPVSRMPLTVSTNFFVAAQFHDRSWTIPVQIPARMSGADYFAGKDSAMDAVLVPDGGATILGILETAGGEAARTLYDKRKALYANLTWWEPFARIDMNGAGYRLLEAGKVADAVAAMEMNADRYPETWETWDSLAEVQMTAKNYPSAIASYERALHLSPDNWNAAAEQKAVTEMKEKLGQK